MNKFLPYPILVLLTIFACEQEKTANDSYPPPLYPPPISYPLDTVDGYIIKHITGDTIQPIINIVGDTVITGRRIPAIGKVIDPDSIAKPKTIKAGKPEIVLAHNNRHKIPDQLTVIQVNHDSLPTFTAGVDTSSFLLINNMGDTIPTGIPIPTQGRIVPTKQPKPIKAMVPSMKDNTMFGIQYLDVDHGLKSNLIASLMEDANGNIWIGTDGGGVSKYNGESFVNFTIKDGLTNDFVRSILEDRQGNVWFGTYENVSKYDGKSFTHFTEKQGLSDYNVSCIIEDQQGNIWIGTWGGGLNKYEPSEKNLKGSGSFTHFTEKQGLSSNDVSAIIEDQYGNIWIGTVNGLNKYTPSEKSRTGSESFTHFTEKQGLSDNYVSSIIEDQQGNIWIGTRNGLNKYDPSEKIRTGSGSFTHFTEKQGLSDNNVSSILEDKQGNIWIGTWRGGVNKYNPSEKIRTGSESFTHFTVKQGLSNNNVSSLLEDHQGNIWIGTSGGGVSKYSEKSFVCIREKNGTVNPDFFSIQEDRQGNIWFGTWGRGVCKYDGHSFTYFTEKQGFPNKYVRSLMVDMKGNIWLGTWGEGVSKFDGESFTNYGVKEGLSGNYIWTIFEDSRGNIWFGTLDNGVTKYDGLTFIHYTEKEGFISNVAVWSVIEDHLGNIWFGTEKGVSKYDGNSFIHFTEKEGLCHDEVVVIVEDNSGNLWFGSEVVGAIKFDGKSFTHFTEKQGLKSGIVWSMAKDQNDNIWLGTTGGGIYTHIQRDSAVSSIAKNKVENNFRIKAFGKQDGLASMDFWPNSLLVDSKNRIWHAHREGASVLDLNNLQEANEPPEIHLNHLEINNQFIDYRILDDRTKKGMTYDSVAAFFNYPIDLKLPHDQNHLTFHFSAIDWSAPHKIRYSYKIDGLDEQWSQPSREAKAEYRNMPYGNHSFKVQAIGESGEWSAPFEYAFTILPPWWLTWWAKSIWFTMAALLLTLLYKIRVRSLKAQRTKLQIQVGERTKELEQSNYQLRQLDEYKESMTAMIVHDFKNSLNTVISFSEGSPTERRLKSIRQAGQFMLNMVLNILDVQKFEAAEVRLSLANYHIGKVLNDAVQQMSYMLEQKSIKLSYIQNDLHCRVDYELVTRVVINILSNAIKYVPANGSIEITTERKNDLLVVAIKDNGQGIPANKVHMVFDKYAQVNAKKSGSVRSTGIGLTFCKMVVEAHGGTIGVESKEGEGSEFYFTVPLIEDIEELAVPFEKKDRESESVLVFSEMEMAQLQPILEALKQWEVYDYSEVKTIIDDIAKHEGNITSWKERLQKAIHNGNEKVYNELINL